MRPAPGPACMAATRRTSLQAVQVSINPRFGKFIVGGGEEEDGPENRADVGTSRLTTEPRVFKLGARWRSRVPHAPASRPLNNNINLLNAPASKTRPSIHIPGLLPSARRAPAKLTPAPGTQTSPLGPRHVTMTRQPEPTVATGPHTSQAPITTIPNPKPVAPRFARPLCAASVSAPPLSFIFCFT